MRSEVEQVSISTCFLGLFLLYFVIEAINIFVIDECETLFYLTFMDTFQLLEKQMCI